MERRDNFLHLSITLDIIKYLSDEKLMILRKTCSNLRDIIRNHNENINGLLSMLDIDLLLVRQCRVDADDFFTDNYRGYLPIRGNCIKRVYIDTFNTVKVDFPNISLHRCVIVFTGNMIYYRNYNGNKDSLRNPVEAKMIIFCGYININNYCAALLITKRNSYIDYLYFNVFKGLKYRLTDRNGNQLIEKVSGIKFFRPNYYGEVLSTNELVDFVSSYYSDH